MSLSVDEFPLVMPTVFLSAHKNSSITVNLSRVKENLDQEVESDESKWIIKKSNSTQVVDDDKLNQLGGTESTNGTDYLEVVHMTPSTAIKRMLDNSSIEIQPTEQADILKDVEQPEETYSAVTDEEESEGESIEIQSTEQADNPEDSRQQVGIQSTEQVTEQTTEQVNELTTEQVNELITEQANEPITEQVNEQIDEQENSESSETYSNEQSNDESELSTTSPRNIIKTKKTKRKAKVNRGKFGSRLTFSKVHSVQSVVLDLTLPAVPPPPTPNSRLSLVLFTTADSSQV